MLVFSPEDVKEPAFQEFIPEAGIEAVTISVLPGPGHAIYQSQF